MGVEQDHLVTKEEERIREIRWIMAKKESQATCFYTATSKMTFHLDSLPGHFLLNISSTQVWKFFYMQFKILLDGDGVGGKIKGLGAENLGPKGSFKKNNPLN